MCPNHAWTLVFHLLPTFEEKVLDHHYGYNLERLRPVVEGSGYIPGCDHDVPPDIPWPNFMEYGRLLAQMIGWL
jgi:hypothetical protein